MRLYTVGDGVTAELRRLMGVPPLTEARAHEMELQAQDPRMVPVDGYQMRVWMAGLNHPDRAQPVVVLESGLGGPLEEWNRVFSKVAAFAPVLAYDRAGVGQSESDRQPPTPPHVAQKLHSLLAQMGLRPPYVLVGHSWGGPLIRMFAGLYPKQVAGLVYVDPTDMRTEEDELAYYKGRGHAAENVPKLRRGSVMTSGYGCELAGSRPLHDRQVTELSR
jgi:pimeloyl-ACP methyl ester carboxylesterase